MKLKEEYGCGMEGWDVVNNRDRKCALMKLIENTKRQKEKCLEKLNVSHINVRVKHFIFVFLKMCK